MHKAKIYMTCKQAAFQARYSNLADHVTYGNSQDKEIIAIKFIVYSMM